MKINTKIAFNLVAGLCAVTMFAGCDYFKKSEEKKVDVPVQVVEVDDVSPILLKIDGKNAITETQFNKHLGQMLQMNPYFRGAGIDCLPIALKRKFFEELIKQELFLAWAEKNGLDKDEQFIKSYKEIQNLVRRSLMVQMVEKTVLDGITISEKELKAYFDENKEKFVKEPGGVLVEGIKFNSEEKAKEFYDKARGKSLKDFTELAKAEGADNFQDFGRVNDAAVPQQQAFMMAQSPSEIKKKSQSIKNFPAIDIVKAGKDAWWVAYFSDKQDKVYLTLEEVLPQIDAMLKQNKFREAIGKKVDELRSKFTLDVNEEFFKEPAKTAPKMQGVAPKGLGGMSTAA